LIADNIFRTERRKKFRRSFHFVVFRSGSNRKLRGMPRARANTKLRKLVSLQLEWFARHARDLPWRRTRDPYAIWVSEIMLQQTQVKTVIPFWERWMRELPTIEALANADSEEIHKLWEGLGYYTRVRNMQKAAQFIGANHGGQFPANFADVLALPGIGRYTAGAICSIAFNQPTPILDGNVIRVLTRIFAIAENPKETETNALLWHLAEQLVSHAKNAKFAKENELKIPSRPLRPSREANYCSALNQSLMELGALICTPRSPQCLICPAKTLCEAFKQGRTEELPNLGKRTEITERRFAAFVVRKENRVLVRQRPAGVVNAHLWEFPNVELLNGKADPAVAAKELLGFTSASLEKLCAFKHSITRYRITLEAFALSDGAKASGIAGEWLTLSELKKLSFPSAHRKILSLLAREA
jgi:A/G-specific adenine glycosylase